MDDNETEEVNTTVINCDLTTLGKKLSDFIQWFRIIIPIICIIGIIGNALNFVFLLRKRCRTSSCDVIGRSANNAMISLATSDMLFCLSVFPQTFSASHGFCVTSDELYVIYYRAYGVAFINLFLMTGTILVSITAYMRYVAVTSPLCAKNRFILKRNGITLTVVVILCIILTLPQFYYFDIYEEDNSECTTSSVVFCVYHRFEDSVLLWIDRREIYSSLSLSLFTCYSITHVSFTNS